MFIRSFIFLLTSIINIEAGSITGLVQLQTTDQPTPPKRYYMGPYRSGRHTSTNPDSPQNTVIYLQSDAPAPKTAPPDPVFITQKNETFIPHVLPIQVGTSVGFPNEDEFYHNVFSVMSGDRFDLGRYAKGETTYQKFEKPGIVVVRCEIHPGMKAYILVLDTPYFTVPSQTGTYTLPNILPGTYQLFAWHPDRGTHTQTIVVPETGLATANFSF